MKDFFKNMNERNAAMQKYHEDKLKLLQQMQKDKLQYQKRKIVILSQIAANLKERTVPVRRKKVLKLNKFEIN